MDIQCNPDPIEAIERKLDFKKFLSTLQNMDACIFCMKECDKMSYRQIGKMIGISHDTAIKSFRQTELKFKEFFK